MTTFIPAPLAAQLPPVAHIEFADGTRVPLHVDETTTSYTFSSSADLEVTAHGVWPHVDGQPHDPREHTATVQLSVPLDSVTGRAILSTLGTFQ